MKFSKYLESQSVPEWRKAYINYKGLKKKLKQVERVSSSNNTTMYKSAAVVAANNVYHSSFENQKKEKQLFI